MQDRFKFRLYDDIHREMIDLQEQDVNPYNISDIPQNNIMQCTGLKDKNGKLIYEGDILRVIGNRDTSGYGVVEYLQAGCQFFVNGYLNNPSPYHPRKKGEFYQQLQEWLCTEVIGNIYENTELLEVHHD